MSTHEHAGTGAIEDLGEQVDKVVHIGGKWHGNAGGDMTLAGGEGKSPEKRDGGNLSAEEHQVAAEAVNVAVKEKRRSLPEGGDAEPCNILPEMKTFSCHFTWGLENSDFPPNKMLRILNQGDEEYQWSEENAIRDLHINSMRAYYYCQVGNWKLAEASLKTAETFVGKEDLQTGQLGLRYMLRAEWAFILCAQCRQEEAKKLLLDSGEDAVPSDWTQLNKVEKAVIMAVKGLAYSHLGSRGNKEAMNFFFEATKLEPCNPEWHFLLGKVMGRIRREMDARKTPMSLESRSLEKAVELRPTASAYLLFLAQCLREKANALYHRDAASGEELHALNLRAKECYLRALKANPDCPRTNVRCADGFMKMPLYLREKKMASECLARALQHAPDNSMVHHKMGYFYEKHELDHVLALEHYRRAVGEDMRNFPAFMGMASLRIRTDPSWDPVPDMERAAHAHRGAPTRVAVLLCFQGMYLWMVRGDFQGAFQSWRRAFNIEPTCRSFTYDANHKCFPGAKKSICEILIKELSQRLPMESSSEKKEQMEEMLNAAKELLSCKDGAVQNGLPPSRMSNWRQKAN